MSGAKDILLKPIGRREADAIVHRYHYSGKTVNNTQVNIGVFYRNQIEGAIQIGPPLDRRKLLGLVRDTPWNGMAEINRMAFSDCLPPNSESRALAVMCRLLRRHRPDLQWLVSFADATQCGDGTIYRAAGFALTAIKPSIALCRLPDGSVVHEMTLQSNPTQPRPELGGRSFYDVTGGKYDWRAYVRAVGGTILPGFQLRYIAFLDPTARERLTVPILPYSAIDEAGARMYKGEPQPPRSAGSADGGTPEHQSGGAGSNPSPALQSSPGRRAGK